MSANGLFPQELLKWPPEQDNGLDQKHLQDTAQILENTLKKFGIVAQVVQIIPGPTVTLYEVLPAEGVAVNRIAAREADLKQALAVSAIRVVAPIPGKSVVGVEVPNPKPVLVKLREILAFEKFEPGAYTLPFALGKDIPGKPVVVDLQKMPHLLIVGAATSGKSTCIANLLLTLLYRLTPAQLRLILIDPTRAYLSLYSDIPHLLSPPILDRMGAVRAIKWLVSELERRLNTLSDSGAKNIESYNQEPERLGVAPMPYIVVVVDELADLMVADPRVKIEDAITRLARMSSAVGIHLVLASQRPSMDVITGLFKANIPARIAFRTTSDFDSRAVIDSKDASCLLGNGDLLLSTPNSSPLRRIQGAHVDSEEIRRVADFLKSQMKPEYVDMEMESEKTKDSSAPESHKSRHVSEVPKRGDSNARDVDSKLYKEAKQFVIGQRKAWVWMLENKFGITRRQAEKIIEILKTEGIYGGDGERR